MTPVSRRNETPSKGTHLIPPVGMLSRDEAQRLTLKAAEDARRRVDDANLSKLEWLRAVSHELRTPLNAIGGFVQLLKSGARGEVPAAMMADLDRIERNQLHMARLIEEVLQFARLEAGGLPFEVAPVPVSRLLLDIQDHVPREERARGRAIIVRRPDADLVVRADEDKARQIVLNLVANALRRTPATATIEAYVEPDGERMMRLCVRDEGPPIPPERLSSVFEPFFQSGNSLNRPAGGFGLGLGIARALARGMGGDLTVASTASGSTFTLTLPRV